MSIAFGSPASSANVNANMASKNVDNSLAGKQTVTDTTQSTDKDTGSIVTEGGLGVEKNINAGGNIAAVGTMSATNLSNTNTGDLSTAAVGSTPNANAMSLTGQVLNLEPADATNPGVMTATAQSVGGKKTLVDGALLQKLFQLEETVDSSTTGSDAVLTVTNPFTALTNASLVSIGTIASPLVGQFLVLVNRTGAQITFKNNSTGTAAERILTGTGSNLNLANDASLVFIYESNQSRWQVVGGSGGGTSFDDSTFQIFDNGDNTKIIKFELSNQTTGTTKTFQLPVANTTLVGIDTAQVLTLKDIDGGTASNTNRITLPKDTLSNLNSLTRKAGTLLYGTDTNKPYYDDGSNLKLIGSGAAGKNYLPDGDAEGANPFVMYADGAAIPVDGTGGSATAAITQSSSSPLADVKSFLFTNGSLGDGGAYAFTIDAQDKSTMQTLILSTEVGVAGWLKAGRSAILGRRLCAFLGAGITPILGSSVFISSGLTLKSTVIVPESCVL